MYRFVPVGGGGGGGGVAEKGFKMNIIKLCVHVNLHCSFSGTIVLYNYAITSCGLFVHF